MKELRTTSLQPGFSGYKEAGYLTLTSVDGGAFKQSKQKSLHLLLELKTCLDRALTLTLATSTQLHLMKNTY